MGRVLNLMAFVIFATTLFMRSVDPVIPQIATGLNVTPTTAALLSTGFTLPYALIQPVLGALADMFSKTRLIAACMFVVGISTVACGFATNFETLMALRVIAGIAAGGVFPIALAVAGDRVPVQQRQVAIGRLLFAAMSGNLLGASGAGVIGDLVGWRGVFFVTGAIDLIALAVAIPGFRSMDEKTGRFRFVDAGSKLPRDLQQSDGEVLFRRSLRRGRVPVRRVSLYGRVAAYRGRRARIDCGHCDRRVRHWRRHLYLHGRVALAHVGERRLMAAGGMVMGFCLIVIAMRMPWPVEFANFVAARFRILPAARLYPGLCHRVGPLRARFCNRSAFHVLLSWSGGGAGYLRHRPEQRGCGACSVRGRGGVDCNRLDLRGMPAAAGPGALTAPAIGRDALVGHPHILGQLAGLPEHIDRHAAARIPVAADAQPLRLKQRRRASCRCATVQSSWKAPWLRKLLR